MNSRSDQPADSQPTSVARTTTGENRKGQHRVAKLIGRGFKSVPCPSSTCTESLIIGKKQRGQGGGVGYRFHCPHRECPWHGGGFAVVPWYLVILQNLQAKVVRISITAIASVTGASLLAWAAGMLNTPDFLLSSKRQFGQPALADSEEAEQPFSIESAFILVHFRDEGSKRFLTAQTILTLRLNADRDDAQELFTKKYIKSGCESLNRWAGSALEDVIFEDDVSFSARVLQGGHSGDVVSRVFGAKLEYNLPLPAHGRDIRSIVEIDSDEAWWGYINHHGVMIRELTICVSSDQYELSMPERLGSFRVLDDGSVSKLQQEMSLANIPPKQGCLWTRWTNVKPNQLVALRYSWREPGTD